MTISHYRCIKCTGSLSNADEQTLVCTICGNRYPVISGIPVFLLRPTPYLFSCVNVMQAEKARLQRLGEWVEQHRDAEPPHALTDRALRMIEGVSTNLRLMEQSLAPVARHIQPLHMSGGFSDWFFSYASGRTFEYMLRYFYQDWLEPDDFLEVKDLIVKLLVEENRVSLDSIAVLGCGACGLLYHIAPYAKTAYGLDLALATLMAAKSLLEGQDMVFALPDAEWKTVQITAPEPSPNIRFISADITRLPFDDHSLSVVVTQFMLDLVGDPASFASEVWRVLKEDGLWINFSSPVAIPGDPPDLGPRLPDEMAALLESLGFSVIASERKRFKLWNFTKINNGGPITDYDCHFFVIRKSARPAPVGKDGFSRYFMDLDQAILDAVPQVIDSHKVSIIVKNAYSAGQVEETRQINVKSKWLPLPSAYAGLIEAILANIDGRKTIRDIHNHLVAGGTPLKEEELVEFFLAMTVYYSVLKLS